MDAMRPTDSLPSCSVPHFHHAMAMSLFVLADGVAPFPNLMFADKSMTLFSAADKTSPVGLHGLLGESRSAIVLALVSRFVSPLHCFPGSPLL